MADVVLMENVDGVHTFSAYVLVDFEASVVGVELSVKKGEWVAVTVDDDDEPPKGWCMCCVTRPAEGESYGLVPWSYLVSAAHAELKAAAEGLERSGEGGAADRTEELGLRLARGQDGAFGLDIDDLNCVRRTSPGGAAESSQIRVGDVVIAVDGELLAGRSIVEVMRPGAPEYEVTVLRGIFSHDEVGSPDAAARRARVYTGHVARAVCARRADGLRSTRGVYRCGSVRPPRGPSCNTRPFLGGLIVANHPNDEYSEDARAGPLLASNV